MLKYRALVVILEPGYYHHITGMIVSRSADGAGQWRVETIGGDRILVRAEYLKAVA